SAAFPHAFATLLKRLEQSRLRLRQNSGSGIDDFETIDGLTYCRLQIADCRFGRVSFGAGFAPSSDNDPQYHFALFRKLDRIPKQIDQHLAQLAFVPMDEQRLASTLDFGFRISDFGFYIPFHAPTEATLLATQLEHAGQALNQFTQIEIGSLQLHLACFD